MERQRQYLEYITNQMINYAQLNFDNKLDIIYDEGIDELVPGIAVGVNILGEELQHKVKELKHLNEELEKRNTFIKSITDAVPEVIYVYNHVSNSITFVNKCTNTNPSFPCPIVKLKLALPCTHCGISSLILQRQKEFVVEEVNQNEIKISLTDNTSKWYKTTSDTFEKDKDGNTLSTLQTLSDITLLKEKELKLLENERTISHSLKEKELLLQEVHHRVKNNLQIISGLLNMQVSRANSEVVTEQLQEIQSRIHSISLIHEELYHTDNFTYVDISKYCRKLSLGLSALYNYNNNVELIFSLEPGIFLSIDKATPMGLLINETICNCFKHGFKNSREGMIWITLSSDELNYFLEIKDNGNSEEVIKMDANHNDSLGNKLIHGLAMQLDGELAIKTDNGYSVTLSIPKVPAYN